MHLCRQQLLIFACKSSMCDMWQPDSWYWSTSPCWWLPLQVSRKPWSDGFTLCFPTPKPLSVPAAVPEVSRAGWAEDRKPFRQKGLPMGGTTELLDACQCIFVWTSCAYLCLSIGLRSSWLELAWSSHFARKRGGNQVGFVTSRGSQISSPKQTKPIAHCFASDRPISTGQGRRMLLRWRLLKAPEGWVKYLPWHARKSWETAIICVSVHEISSTKPVLAGELGDSASIHA